MEYFASEGKGELKIFEKQNEFLLLGFASPRLRLAMTVIASDSEAIHFVVITELHFFNNSEFCTSGGFIALDFGIVRNDNFLVYQLKGSAFC